MKKYNILNLETSYKTQYVFFNNSLGLLIFIVSEGREFHSLTILWRKIRWI